MGKARKILYTITDAHFPELKIYKSANAWWVDKNKVIKLIDAFKSRHTMRTACVYAGISRDQYIYFIQIHPDFLEVKERCKELVFIRAMNTLNSNLDNISTVKWLLKNSHPNFNSKLKQEDIPVGSHKCVSAAQMQKAAETMAESKKAEAKEIADALRSIAKEVFGENDPEKVEEIVNNVTEEVKKLSGESSDTQSFPLQPSKEI